MKKCRTTTPLQSLDNSSQGPETGPILHLSSSSTKEEPRRVSPLSSPEYEYQLGYPEDATEQPDIRSQPETKPSNPVGAAFGEGYRTTDPLGLEDTMPREESQPKKNTAERTTSTGTGTWKLRLGSWPTVPRMGNVLDPRLLFRDAPSSRENTPVGEALRAFRQQATRGDATVTMLQRPGSVQRIETATLPDGTTYRLESTWCPDRSPPRQMKTQAAQTQ